MKSRTRKRIFRGAAAVMACVAAAGIFLQSTMSVEAAANSMPGIDIIVNGNSNEKPFRILELVNDSEKAEIGYYVSGQEPNVKLYTYTDPDGNMIHFSTLEEGLSRLPEKERKEFAMNVKIDADGNIDTVSSTGITKVEMQDAEEDAAPLSYKSYKEKYFLENGDNEADWTQIGLKDADGNSRVDSVEVNGSYVENTVGTGNYTKEEQQYYPIRQDVEADKTQSGLFRENIENFSYMEDEDVRSAYFLEFSEVNNIDVNDAFSDDADIAQNTQEKIQAEYDYRNGRYGYYENVYTDLTEDIVNGIDNKKYSFPGENPDNSAIIDGNSKAVMVQDNQIASANGDRRIAIGGVNNTDTAGTQENPYIYLGENIDSYPYYQYKWVGDLAYVEDKAKENHDNGYEEGDIILDDGQYWYIMNDPNNDQQLLQTELSIVTGRQPVAYEDISNIPEDFQYNYYYMIDKVWFCCELSDGGLESDPSDYQFFGWYYPTYPNGEDIYLSINGSEIPTYYISEAQYMLTIGVGDYDFVPDINDETQIVQVNELYYQGGYENHDWMKKYVFHLEREGYDGFCIHVDTRYADDASKPVHANVSESEEVSDNIDVTSYDLIYVNGELSENLAINIADSDVPCIINMGNADNENLQTAFVSSLKSGDADGNYVNKKRYFFKESDNSGLELVNNDFAKTFTATQAEGFEEITKYIEQENQYRALGENGSQLDPLSLELSQARVVEYIINYQYKRTIDVKSEINVLQIMPDVGCEEVSEDDIAQWISGKQAQSTTKKHIMTVNTCCEQKGSEAAPPSNMTDGDLTTFWHSDWSKQWGSGDHLNETGINDKDRRHYIDVSFAEPEDIQGFVYTPRSGSVNGVLQDYKVVLYDKNGNELASKTGNTGYTKDNYSGAVSITFDGVVSDVSKMRIIFESALEKNQVNAIFSSNSFATCAELSILYADRAIITACCEQTKQNDASPAANMTDNDPNTFWHSDYTDKWSSSIHKAQTEKKHYIQVDFTNPEEVKGFSYMPRSDNANRANGTLVAYTVELYGSDGQVLKTITGNTGYTKTSFSGKKSIQFSQAVSSVKMMRVYFDSALYDNAANDDKTSSEFASCAEFKVLYSSATESEITVTTMTASEFVGHIDDFASEYDMIYISGTKLSSSNPLITGADELRYSHVGSGKQITADSAKRDNTITGLTKLLGQLDIEYDNWTGNDGETRRFAPISTYGPDGGGYYRGSGNDMTSNQCDELLDFVKSGYPVIVGDALISNGKVNTVRVDNSSWYYQFLSEAINYQNVLTAESLNENSENLAFFANLAKPVITFVEKPAEPIRAGESNVEGSGYINGELRYVFTIGNDSDAAPASTTYDCKLYIDLNFDGNLSQKEAQDKYMILQDEDGNVLSQVSYGENDQRYELQAGKKYTLTRKIPESYFKLITWKLEVLSNQNHYIHTSQQGYAKQKNTGSKQPIKVLQLLPQKANQGGYKGGSWVLDDQNGTFQRLIKQIDDFDIQIDTIYVKNPADDTKKRDVTSMKSGEMKELLKQYQMLVIGFNDNYQDIPNNNGQVEDILDFIKSGKSVLFSHDTASFINYDRDKMYGKIASTAYGVDEDADIYFDNWIINTVKDPTWGLSLNTILRSVVGMDRYGITSDEEIDGKSITSILKKGQALDSQSVNFEELMQLAGDVAWKANSSRSSSYAQTQAYSNHMMAGISLGASENLTTKANRINDGAITEYPYRMSSIETGAGTLTISTTHGQYYQLGLEQDRDINGNSDGETDVVVWYCLTGNSVYNASPNDARNSYYFYSKGNVIYTGAGHSQVNQESEIKLFINAMVAAANVTAVDPEVNFVEELNPTADVETTRYYSTDQSSWTNDEANVLEQSMDFYVNVKDYNMVSADLNQDDLDKQEMTLEFFIDSDDGEHQDGADGSSNMTNITKAIGSLKGYDGTTAEVGSDGAFHLTRNTAYQLTLSNLEQYLKTTGFATSGDQNGYRKDCKLHVKVTSTVYLYGEPKVSTKWASIDLKQRQLFELN